MTDFIPFFFLSRFLLLARTPLCWMDLKMQVLRWKKQRFVLLFQRLWGNWKTDNQEAYNNMMYVIMCSTVLCHIIEICLQARLNEIITSGVKTVQSNGISPWMADGSGLPSNASELLPKLVTALNLLVYIMYRSSILHLVE